jgi:hypothetical protein
MSLFKTTRRKFFAIAGASPLAAKATIDTEIGKLAGLSDMSEMVNAGISINPGPPVAGGSYLQQLDGALNYIKVFGVPEFMETEARGRSLFVNSFDIDIANKRSWSMAFKIALQRQRNYEREIERLKIAATIHQKRFAIKKFIGFDWPWY